MAGIKADLHTHTTASDGKDTPARVVAATREAGLLALAITDHDTVAGLPEALEAGAFYGVQVVPGVELSASREGKSIHVLGLAIDWQDGILLQRLEQLRERRQQRNVEMVGRLQALGLPITMGAVEAAAGVGAGAGGDASAGNNEKEKSVGRPHIAAALVKEGAVASIAEAFARYLDVKGAAYVPMPTITPAEALQWIRDAGGVSVIAHPGLYGNDQWVEQWLAEERCGIEVYHSEHSRVQELQYEALAERYGVVATGGSDYHGMQGGRAYHGHVGARGVTMEIVEQLYSAARRTEP